MTRPISVLFLCTGNSCRSIMAEALLAHYGGGRFLSLSAGSSPTGEVHPLSLATLKERGLSVTGYHSKSWNELVDQPIDIVVTVCDNAAGESCPLFPGEPIRTHWGVPDPAKFEGDKEATIAEFHRICDRLEKRITQFVSLPLTALTDRTELQREIDGIGAL